MWPFCVYDCVCDKTCDPLWNELYKRGGNIRMTLVTMHCYDESHICNIDLRGNIYKSEKGNLKKLFHDRTSSL